MNDYLNITDQQNNRLEELYAGYRQLYEDPESSSPKMIIHVPVDNVPSWEQQLADPLVMLKAQLDQIRTHLAICDDYVPAVRVNFGTAQVAAAFGCDLVFPNNSLPAAGTHVLKRAQDVYRIQKPALDAGWFSKLRSWTDIWLEEIPEGIHIQHPDIQGAFNSAHLIRGNDILTDFYDCPETVDALLELVTDYMIDLIPMLKSQISSDDQWFFDWGAMWKGTARISNCSSDLIGPDLYLKHVFKYDMKLLNKIGGGRMHCCASSEKVIDTFLGHAEITGLDCDAGIHDIWRLSEIAPANVPLVIEHYGHPFPELERLLKGDWPKKRNLILITQADSIDEGKFLLQKLRRSVT